MNRLLFRSSPSCRSLKLTNTAESMMKLFAFSTSWNCSCNATTSPEKLMHNKAQSAFSQWNVQSSWISKNWMMPQKVAPFWTICYAAHNALSRITLQLLPVARRSNNPVPRLVLWEWGKSTNTFDLDGTNFAHFQIAKHYAHLSTRTLFAIMHHHQEI